MKKYFFRNHPKRSVWSIVLYAGIACAAIILFSVFGLLLFPDPFINQYITPRLEKTFSALYPGYSIRLHGVRCTVLKNVLVVDSITIRNRDSTAWSTVQLLSMKGISWLPLIRGNRLTGEHLSDAVFEAQEIVLTNMLLHYVVRCGPLHISIPDSQVRAESIHLEPNTDDESFFARSAYRQSRYRIHIPFLTLTGIFLPDLLMNNVYRARSIGLHNPSLDILVNKDKMDRSDSAFYNMPNGMLASLQSPLQVDTVSIVAANVIYGERFGVRKKPAAITIEKLQVLALGLTNDESVPLTIQAQGVFMKSGAMNIRILFPPASPDFSFRYSGTLGSMNVQELNVFLETAEQVRVRGAIRSAAFEVIVRSGRALGTVRVEYSDLSFAFINSKTGSEKGIGDRITSFIANTFTIRKNNVPDKSGAIAIGKIDYSLTHEDPFFRFVWFALRSGVKDVVGF
ncbi:MAG: hypothetical protein WCW35_01985 [Bacteroidota bacterium]|jgi:hypothetical protein